MKSENTVRIIGGMWRGRKVTFPSCPGLRPTQDRIRETIFNWLTPNISNAVCLDLFAGSGVLGLEALSRGAAEAIFIDKDKLVTQFIQQNCNRLDTRDNTTIVTATCPSEQLVNLLNGRTFDLVFLDPPYRLNLLLPSLRWLYQSSLLNAGTLIYVEYEVDLNIDFPLEFVFIKKKKTKSHFYGLLMLK